MAEAPTQQGLLSNQSFGTIAPYEPNMVERAQGLLAQGLMKFGYDPRDAYVQANKIINTQGDMGAADFTPIAGDLIGAQDSYDMGVDAKRAFEREEYLKSLGYGAGSAATGLLSGLGVLGTIAPPLDKVLDAARVGVKKATGLLTNDVDDLGFYSPTERLATTLQPKGTGQQYLGILSKGDGKGSRIQEEMQDMGLDTWLQNKGKVSRDEVLDYIGENRLRYGEEVLTSKNPYPYRTGDEWQNAVMQARRRRDFDEVERLTSAWESSEGYGFAGDTRHQQYSQTGGTGYQENLLIVPRKQVSEKEARGILGAADDAPPLSKSDINYATHKKYGVYASPPSHYEQNNIGLTTRTQSFNTPQGDSVHLMDELQSDWHKEGGKGGYTNKGFAEWDAEVKELQDQIRSGRNFDQMHDLRIALETNKDKIVELQQGYNESKRSSLEKSVQAQARLDELMQNKLYKNAVPDAPAKQSWMNQGIKKEINQTIADGRDYFAWTGGDIQADRYSLRKQVENIDYDITDNTLSAYAPDGSVSIMETVQPDKLDDFIGKEAADKIRTKIGYSDEQGMRSYYKQKAIEDGMAEPSADALSKTYTPVQIKNKLMDMDNAEGLVRLTGEELEVGGGGMKSFYDKDVKKRTEKIIKRLDPNAKVEVIELDNGNKVWGVKITDQMRDKVKSEGMPLYSIAPIAGAGLLGAGMMRQEEQQPQQGILN